MNEFRYVLITAARNEEAHIEKTIHSVIAQTIRPRKWIIVSDGSTDRTDEIVSRYVAKYDFIELLRAEAAGRRNFGSKVKAISIGCKLVSSIEHKYVAILDADVSFGPTYYESVMQKFEENPNVGIAGGVLFDRHKDEYIQQITSPDWSVSGPIQMFRRECYEQIGGYVPVRGGVDAVAEIMARMKGWKVRAFPDIPVLHHRATGAEKGDLWQVFYSRGVEDYLLGYHFIFFLAKCFRRCVERPYFFGSFLMFCGYCGTFVGRVKRQVSPEFVRYLRKEQVDRVRFALLSPKRAKPKGVLSANIK